MSESLGTVLGRIPSGLFILTARHADGSETGMLASWVQQAAFDPPAVSIALNRKRYLIEWLTPGAALAISLVGETQKNLLGHFGKGFEPGEAAFSGLEIERTPLGLPALADSLGWLEGTVVESIPAGDHNVLIVRLTAAGPGRRLAEERPFVHIRKNGLGY